MLNDLVFPLTNDRSVLPGDLSVAGDVSVAGTLSAAAGSGFGIAPTDGTLHVHTASAGAVTAAAEIDDLVVENNTHGGISILTPDNAYGRVAFGSPNDAQGALIQHQYDEGTLYIGSETVGGDIKFRTNGTSLAVTIVPDRDTVSPTFN